MVANVSGLAQGTGTMTEHSLKWIFVGGMIFSFLDAFGVYHITCLLHDDESY